MPIQLKPNNNKKKSGWAGNLFWMYAIIVIVLVGIFYLDDNSITKEVSYSNFVSYVEKDHGINKIIVAKGKGEAEGFLTDSLAEKLFPGQFEAGKGMVAKVVTDIPSADKIDEKIELWKQTGAFPADGEIKYEQK